MIIAIKNARISEFNGRSINCGDDHTVLIFEPNDPKTAKI
jgi:hypothetical protein